MHGIDKPFEKNYVTKSGAKYSIRCTPQGLFFITMNNGGVKPKFCDERFTNFRKAEKAITDHSEVVSRT